MAMECLHQIGTKNLTQAGRILWRMIKKLSLSRKKRKSDKRMEGQGRNIMEVENLSLALMPHTQSGGDLQEKRGTKEVIDGSKKMKKENAGLPEQLRAQK